jgi:signal transduction histidine kinase
LSLWLGFGIFDAMQTVLVMHSEGMHHAWLRLFFVTVVSWLPWALATPLVLHLGRRFPPVSVKPYRGWLAHAGTCIAIGLVFAGWTALLEVAFNPYADATAPGFATLLADKFSNGLLSSLVLYAVILAVTYGLESRVRLARAQTETARLSEGLSQAQLSALRRQIAPHFLFNALNTVAGLIREGRGDDAVSAIAALGDFLRKMLDDGNRQEVPLREEMEFVNDYLNIQKLRFAERLQLSVDVPSEFNPVAVPNLILQPLVENAIVHGISKRAGGGAIRITASGCDGRLTVRVCNDGPGLAPDWTPARSGIGLSNVRSRLQSLYGEAFDVSMRDGKAGGVEVSFSVPLRRSAALA